MKDRKSSEVYRNEFYNYYSDENDYPRRIRRPVGILLCLVLFAAFFIVFKLFR